jgi:uncharacterized lipoprotein YddW (UPF0748 family)
MRQHYRFGLLVLIFATFSILFGCIFLSEHATTTTIQDSNNIKREIRGVWLTNINSDVLFDRTRLSNAIKDLKDSNFNTIYPTIWNGGYTLYPSQVMKKEVGIELHPKIPELKNRNLLEELVTEGHKQGLTVIPWFEFGFMAPKNSEIAQKHPDWWTKQSDGSVEDMNVSKQIGEPVIWLNPFRPEVQQLMLDLITEIVSKYDVNGIQLDDHFGLPVIFGYDNYTIKLYQQENNGKSPPPQPKENDSSIAKQAWEHWTEWRINKMTQFLEKLSRKVKEIRPNSILSLSPLEYPYARDNALVDWRTWAKNKLIDEVVIQMYFQDKEFDDRIKLNNPDHPELTEFRKRIAIGICTTQCDPPQPAPSITEVKRQVEEVRKLDYTGVSFFFYETLWNKIPQSELTASRKEVFQNLFPSPVQRPQIGSE